MNPQPWYPFSSWRIESSHFMAFFTGSSSTLTPAFRKACSPKLVLTMSATWQYFPWASSNSRINDFGSIKGAYPSTEVLRPSPPWVLISQEPFYSFIYRYFDGNCHDDPPTQSRQPNFLEISNKTNYYRLTAALATAIQEWFWGALSPSLTPTSFLF
jgi:hypothetical protein